MNDLHDVNDVPYASLEREREREKEKEIDRRKRLEERESVNLADD